jgi:hypothetical protein
MGENFAENGLQVSSKDAATTVTTRSLQENHDWSKRMPPEFEGGYAEKVIGGQQAQYVALEVCGVQEVENENKWFMNHYRCSCGAQWHDEWSASCNDRCPTCNKEIEPYDSEDRTAVICTVDNEKPDFYSVYARHKDGTACCVGDFHFYPDAVLYASGLAQLYNWPIYDKVVY